MMILFLALSLLLASKVRILAAEESTANSPTVRYKLAKMARTFLGLPYRWGECRNGGARIVPVWSK